MKTNRINPNTRIVFNFLDGSLKEYPYEDVGVFNDGFHVILTRRPPSCKKCYGRFHLGKNTKTGHLVLCDRCDKYVDKEFFDAMVKKVSDELMEKIRVQEAIKEEGKVEVNLGITQ